jgi:hypothetical protein
MSRNLRKIAFFVIALMALAGFVSGVLGARDVAYLPGDAPSAPAASAPAIVAPEVTPMPTVTEDPAPAPSSNSPAGQDAVGDLIQGTDPATTQPPPY